MFGPDDYLAKTRSAVRSLFQGIEGYRQVLTTTRVPVFVTSTPLGPAFDSEYEQWATAHRDQLDALRLAERTFLADSFALDTLCGAVLQVAAKGIEIASPGGQVPASMQARVTSHYARYCVGRSIRGVPLGLVILAGRNQHTHFNEAALHDPNNLIFEMLALNHGYTLEQPFRDPAFDLENERLISHADNILTLLRWTTIDKYEQDMRHALGV